MIHSSDPFVAEMIEVIRKEFIDPELQRLRRWCERLEADVKALKERLEADVKALKEQVNDTSSGS